MYELIYQNCQWKSLNYDKPQPFKLFLLNSFHGLFAKIILKIDKYLKNVSYIADYLLFISWPACCAAEFDCGPKMSVNLLDSVKEILFVKEYS